MSTSKKTKALNYREKKYRYNIFFFYNKTRFYQKSSQINYDKNLKFRSKLANLNN